GLAFVFSFIGFVTYLQEHEENKDRLEANAALLHVAEDKYHHSSGEDKAKLGKEIKALRDESEQIEGRWAGSVVWANVLPASQKDDGEPLTKAADNGEHSESSHQFEKKA